LVPENTNFGDGFWPPLVGIAAGLGILTAAALMVFFILFAGTRVVRRTNLLWLLFLLTACILIFSSLLIWTFSQTTFWCTSKSIIGMLGFGLLTAYSTY